MSLESQIRSKESELIELALILLNLYDKNIVDRERYLELAANLMKGITRDVKSLVDRDAATRGLPPSDEELTAIALMLRRIGKDLDKQLEDFESDPEGVKTRLQQTATYAAWNTYRETVKDVADKTNGKVRWHTQEDEMVCEVCQPLHLQVFTVETAPPYPHPNCRCWLEMV